ncbi:hypothetical protein NCAS_0F02720 [Naumovozyma castellii]|uniref:HIT domain-containing protein n=1 Tax=Naumovozyma castellii TaxID=27288 RepID=G0VGY5_NAUCA|nr:hypothetical protein NCAS_0F02720 [Naumovozyma castellii CBS 4309]CCC70756.1 hypothetical protein NCAS_0F02720 [Naumovozyma castellii CBS 4309]
MNISIQDGPEAGQSVPHLHTHVIPRYKLNNVGDLIYQKIDTWDGRRDAYLSSNGRDGRKSRSDDLKPDSEREDRTNEVMYQEARDLNKSLLEEYMKVFPQEKQWLC